ncbi:hypothetical protein Pelo_9791 [Pelomyxa schiedti]|nr:hypothetical protein Pelo_9791 [Pelomyxa schiedti]
MGGDNSKPQPQPPQTRAQRTQGTTAAAPPPQAPPVAPPTDNEPITQAQPDEVPPPPSTPPVRYFHELPGNHRILVIGKSQVGKSTVINVLINGSVQMQNMREPAKVGGEASNGTTDKVTAFYRDGHTLIDSIGFTDPRFSLGQISDSLHEVLFNHRLGLTGFIVVMKHDVLTAQEKGILDMFASLFGNEIWGNSILVITHYDGKGKPSPSAEEYLAMAHHQDYRSILRRFGTRIVVGSFATDCNESIELVFRSRRQVMHDRIVSALATLPPGRNVELKAGFLDRLKVFLWSLFNADSSDVERLIQAFSDEEEGAPNIFFYNRTCVICQEDVTTDILVTQCGHLYHFDCLRTWIDSGHSTCPTCRQEVLHQTRVQYPPVNEQDHEMFLFAIGQLVRKHHMLRYKRTRLNCDDNRVEQQGYVQVDDGSGVVAHYKQATTVEAVLLEEERMITGRNILNGASAEITLLVDDSNLLGRNYILVGGSHVTIDAKSVLVIVHDFLESCHLFLSHNYCNAASNPFQDYWAKASTLPVCAPQVSPDFIRVPYLAQQPATFTALYRSARSIPKANTGRILLASRSEGASVTSCLCAAMYLSLWSLCSLSGYCRVRCAVDMRRTLGIEGNIVGSYASAIVFDIPPNEKSFWEIARLVRKKLTQEMEHNSALQSFSLPGTFIINNVGEYERIFQDNAHPEFQVTDLVQKLPPISQPAPSLSAITCDGILQLHFAFSEGSFTETLADTVLQTILVCCS